MFTNVGKVFFDTGHHPEDFDALILSEAFALAVEYLDEEDRGSKEYRRIGLLDLKIDAVKPPEGFSFSEIESGKPKGETSDRFLDIIPETVVYLL